MPTMIGRRAELAALLVLLDDARQAHGRAVLLLGEAGMGKSTLAEAFGAAAAAAGAVVARGWCTSAETPPYWVWRTLLSEVGPEHPLASPAPAAPLDAYARTILFDRVVTTLRHAGRPEAPLVLLIEDVHWADVPSLSLLYAVVALTRASSVLLVATAREEPTETEQEVAVALRELPTEVVRLRLSGLTVPEVTELLATATQRPASPELAEALRRRTGGNPFFASEVARLLDAQGPGQRSIPPGVREVLQRRLARLDQSCHHLLGVAALSAGADERLDLPTIATVAAMSTVDAAAALQDAVRARLLVAGAPDAVRFAHALVREVVEADLPTARRGELHARIAEVLGPRAGEDEAAAVADHWSHAIHPRAAEEAGRWWLASARSAARRLGFEQAVRDYRRALDAPGVDRLTVLLELGRTHRLAGDPQESRRTLLDAAVLARAARRPEALARAALELGGGVAGFEVPVWDHTQSALLREVVRALPAQDDALRAAVLARLSLALVAEGAQTAAQRVALAAEAVGIAERSGDPPALVAALAAYCDALAGPDHVPDRRAAAERMRALAEASADRPGVLLARRLRVTALLEQGELALAEDEITAYERDLRGLDLPLFSWLPAMWRGMQAILAGDLDTAYRLADQVEALGKRAGSENAAMMAFSLRINAHVVGGGAAAMLPALRALSGQPWAAPAALAYFLHEAGDDTGAAAALDRTADRPLPFDGEWLATMWWHGNAAIALTDPAQAQVAYDALLPYAQVWVVDGMGAALCGVSAELLGRLAAVLGKRAEAADRLSQAVAVYRAVGVDRLAARAERALADLDAARAAAGAPRLPSSPAAERPEEATLVRNGRTWRVSFRGADATLPDSKGMRDLSLLLASPGRDIHVLDLVDRTGTARAAREGDAGEVIDAQARSAYRRRLREIEADLAEAEADADLGRADRLRTEREFLAAELAGALGLGGRARAAADPVERARKAVTMRMGTAVRAIGEVHPALARHLKLAVSTGRFCTYRPEQPVRWEVAGAP